MDYGARRSQQTMTIEKLNQHNIFYNKISDFYFILIYFLFIKKTGLYSF